MAKLESTFFPNEGYLPEMLRRVQAINPKADAVSMARGFLCAKQCQSVVRLMEEHFQRYGLSQGRFTVLLMLLLFPEKEWTPRDLAELAGVSRPTVSGLLRGLGEDGLLKRRPHPRDGRSHLLGLTSKAIRRMKQILPDHHQRLEAAFSDLGERKQQAFHQQFDEMIARFSKL